MSIDDNDGVTLNRIKLKHLTSKKDNYGNDMYYYAIESKDFENIVGAIPKDFKVPWFKGEKNTILKVKGRWLKGNKHVTMGVMANISMKEYDFEGTKGYYVDSIAFK